MRAATITISHVLKLAEHQGWKRRRTTKGHWMFYAPPSCKSPGYETVTIGDATNPHGWQNDLKRLQRAGLNFGGLEEIFRDEEGFEGVVNALHAYGGIAAKRLLEVPVPAIAPQNQFPPSDPQALCDLIVQRITKTSDELSEIHGLVGKLREKVEALAKLRALLKDIS